MKKVYLIMRWEWGSDPDGKEIDSIFFDKEEAEKYKEWLVKRGMYPEEDIDIMEIEAYERFAEAKHYVREELRRWKEVME